MVVRRVLTIVATLVASGVASSASAFVLDFEGISVGTGVNGTANNQAVQSYVSTKAAGVTVQGAVARKAYNGDGYVVGETLGTSDYVNNVLTHHMGFDVFITNQGGNPQTPQGQSGPYNTPYGQSGVDKIVFTFAAAISNISFDWEVFPNGTCRTCGTTSANYPDFKLWAGDANTRYEQYFTGDAAGDFPVSKPGGVSRGANYAQGLGHFSIDFARPVTRVEFVDWPVLIGIDNLDPRRVPEPAMLSILGLALAAAGLARGHRRCV